MEKKRRPIRQKLQSAFFNLAAATLLLTAAAGIISMILIRGYDSRVLLQQMEQNMLSTVKLNSVFADSVLGSYAAYSRFFAERIHELYTQPEGSPADQGNYRIRVIPDGPDTDISSASEDVRLFSQLEGLWKIVLDGEKGGITGFYVCTEKGLCLAYDSFTGSQDYGHYLKSSWYNKARDSRTEFFTDNYSEDGAPVVS